jgi:2-hydroxyglutarate dehydrogenase
MNGSEESARADDAAGSGRFDLAVVGAGIVGLAVARELMRRRPQLKVVVVDKEERVGAHQTGHNSGVLHAGIYYEPGSLKARLCVEGAAQLSAYCEERGIALDRCGKLIVARSNDELGRLQELERRGRANGVPGLRRLDAAGLRAVEPHAVGVAALHSPNTAIVDFPAVARALAQDVARAGGTLALGREVTRVERRPAPIGLGGASGRRSEIVLHHPAAEPTIARHAIFCAGLWSDRLARAAGAAADPRIVPFRGQYLKLTPQAGALVSGLIYPVPDPALPFLGVHLTRHVSGEVWAGPTALLVGARDAYRLGRLDLADLRETLAWPGTWRVVARYWRSGADELRLAASRRAFAAACADYVPAIRADDLLPGQAGVRAQAVSRDGRLVDDFVFADAPDTLHVRNAPSPAATSALAIAALIGDRAQESLRL